MFVTYENHKSQHWSIGKQLKLLLSVKNDSFSHNHCGHR